MVRRHLITLWLAAFINPALGQACDAPDNSHFMYIENPSCEDHWAYYGYHYGVVPQIESKTNILRAKFDNTISKEEVKEFAFNQLALLSMLSDAKEIPLTDGAIETFFVATDFGLFLLPAEGDAAVRKQLVGTTLNMAQQVILGGNGLGPGIYIEMAEILANGAFIYSYSNHTKSFNNLIIASEYLRKFYKYGRDHNRVAAAFNVVDRDNEKIYTKIASQYGMESKWYTLNSDPYNPHEIEKIISTLKTSEKNIVEYCKSHRTCKDIKPIRNAKPWPKASIKKISPEKVFSGDRVKFDSSSSTDETNDAASLMVRWDYDGDGLFDTGWAYKKIGSWTYAKEGTYDVALEVKNSLQDTGTSTYRLQVDKKPEEITEPEKDNPSSLTVNETVTINGVVIGPAYVINKLRNGIDCGIRVHVVNTTTSMKTISLGYNAFNHSGVGIAYTSVFLNASAKSEQDKEQIWMSSTNNQIVDCSDIASFKLDPKPVIL